MTKCIAKSVKKKNKLYKTYLNNPCERNENLYKRYKNKLNQVIKVSKKIYYEEQLIKYKHDTKMVWRTLNEILNRGRKNTKLPNEFIGNNTTDTIKDPSKIANSFNEYFVNIGPKLAKNITNNPDKYLTNNFDNNYKDSMFLDPITENEVETEIANMNINKSPGHDDICSRIIKTTSKEIFKPLTHIFNLTFEKGIIPDKLKIALVTPIFKANENNKFKNYRPISVLTCFSKLLERLMYKRLIKYVEKNKILSKHQDGFRKNRSTELAVIELVDKITKAIDKGEYTIGIFLDLSKAFDTINHKILIKKLEHYGIRGICLKWFENYLENRKQIVKYNQIKSKEMKITSGVPQGSILGPLLSSIHK